MQGNWWLNGLASAEMATLSAVLYLLIYKRLLARWLFLFSMLSVEFLRNLALLIILGCHMKYRHYFYTYWISTAVISVMRVGILADTIRNLRGIDFVTWKVYVLVGTAALSMAAGAFVYCYRTGLKPAMLANEMAVLLNECSALAWGAAVAVILFSMKKLKIEWRPFDARMVNGVFLRIAGSMIIAQMLTYHSRPIRLLGNGIDSICTIAVFSFWMMLLSGSVPDLVNEEVERQEVTNPDDYTILMLRKSRTLRCW